MVLFPSCNFCVCIIKLRLKKAFKKYEYSAIYTIKAFAGGYRKINLGNFTNNSGFFTHQPFANI